MNKINHSINILHDYCEKEDYRGWDPFDGLNSELFNKSNLKNYYLPRLFLIQLLKRSPINFRKILKVPKGYNTKGLSLFLTSYCNLYSISNDKLYLEKINFIAEKLISLRSKNYPESCWGYNFDWQSRAFFLPKYTPTVVATSFVADSLFAAYEITKNTKYLNHALSSANFIKKRLNISPASNGIIFSYSPLDSTRVYNASILGARLLAQAYYYTNNKEYFESSTQAVNYVISNQNFDGSWVYGELKIQKWIDSFHTGFILECISDYMKFTNDNKFIDQLDKGMEYYLKNFFKENGAPKYYNNSLYPIDIHSPAQLITTLYKTNYFGKNKNLANKVVVWTIKNMQHKNGYFYYQKNRFFTSKIPYMRWSQAWMFYALSYFKRGINEN